MLGTRYGLSCLHLKEVAERKLSQTAPVYAVGEKAADMIKADIGAGAVGK